MNLLKYTYKCGWCFSLTLILFLVVTGCQRNESVVEYIPTVKVMEVGKEATGQSRSLSGKVNSANRSSLSFGVGGKVLEIIAEVGDNVAEGQLLAVLDDEGLKLSYEDAQLKLSSARTAYQETEVAFKRISRLVRERGASEKDLESSKTNLSNAESKLKSSQRAVQEAEWDLQNAKLVAPFAGKIEKVSVDPYAEISASAEVIVIQSDDLLEAKVRVPESMIRNVAYGDTVQVKFPSIEGVKVLGTVTSIAAEAIEGNAFPVTVALQHGDIDLRPGMTAIVTFNYNAYLGDDPVYLIPLSAIAIDAALLDQETFSRSDANQPADAPVFVLDPENKVVRLRTISVEKLSNNEVEVYSGLDRGELIVVAGVPFVQDGMKAEQWSGAK